MTTNLLIGLAVTAVPAFVIGYLILNKKPPIFRMYIAMVLVGLGYLVATGAIEDIGSTFGRSAPVATSEPAPVPAASETPKPAQ